MRAVLVFKKSLVNIVSFYKAVKMSKKPFEKIETWIAIFFCIGVIGSILLISFGGLTSKEGGFLSVLLSILSIIASWILARQEGETQHSKAIVEVKDMHNENLRTYALKASEKVINLSDQLTQLGDFLEEELKNTEFDTNQELINSREQRIVSSIQMLGMLKSVNDTSLSDWQGVIGDELEYQREEKAELQKSVIDLTNRLENSLENQENRAPKSAKNTAEFDTQIVLMREDISKLISGIGGKRPIPQIRRKPTRHDVSIPCSNCKNTFHYRQRSNVNGAKQLKCSECNAQFISRFNIDIGKFYLQKRENIFEKVGCTCCGSFFNITLNTLPGTSVETSCDTCGMNYRAVRDHTGPVKLKKVPHNTPEKKEITDEIVAQIKNMLPEQPWPKHTHKDVAEKLNISNRVVQTAIRKLIFAGEFEYQVDGKLYKLKPISDEC
jgi:hypothetical protein